MTNTLFFTNIPPVGWLIIAVVILVLFGRGKISSLMGEVGKGITSFKKGVRDGTAELEQDAMDADEDEENSPTKEGKGGGMKESKGNKDS